MKERKKERKAARLCNSSRNQCIEKWWSAKKKKTRHMSLVNKQTKNNTE
jgi:hypothetical protein